MRYAMRIAESASHQIFERKWRRFSACLFQCGRNHKSKCDWWENRGEIYFLSVHPILSLNTSVKSARTLPDSPRERSSLILWDLERVYLKGEIKLWELKLKKQTAKNNKNNSLPPEIKQDDPLNLSISVSGGKETNKDCLSSGEWTGKSSKLKS